MRRRGAPITISNAEEGSSSQDPATSGRRIRSVKRRRIEKEELTSGRLYFTKVAILPDEFNTSAYSLSELLESIRPVLSLHFNFCVDLEFFMRECPAAFASFPITFIVGQGRFNAGTSPATLREEAREMALDNITVAGAPLPIPYGVHHSKLSLFEDGEARIHVVVSTANLVEGDWCAKTQMFYYCRGKVEEDEVEGNPLFVTDLMTYLTAYNMPDQMDYWLNRLKYTRFEATSNRLISSYPGYHKGAEKEKVGHLFVRSILKEVKEEDTNAKKTLIFQTSSIGSLGPRPSSWLEPQLTVSLRGGRPVMGTTTCFIIFPSYKDVENSIESFMAGGSLPYKKETAERQEWLRGRLCKWRSEKWGRSRAMPHVKCYVQVNADREFDWQIITSANLSKAAWGEEQKEKSQLMVRSYEVGVLILDKESIRVPFDYPLAKYQQDDRPWYIDELEKIVAEKGIT